MYCVYCNLDDPDEVPFNEEHLIAQSIGGTLALTIRVCGASNSRLGNEIDRPFVESWLVNADRCSYNLQSYRSVPTLDLSGIAQINGQDSHVTYKVQGEKKILKLTPPRASGTEV
jgi:hypothetical protein